MRLTLKTLSALACALAVAAVTAATAGATTLTAGVWTTFTFQETGSTADTSPFTFQSSGVAVVTVVDAFCPGDRFTVSDGAITLGNTSDVPIGATCPGPIYELNPDPALADPAFSRGRFLVGAGAHSIGVVALISAFGGGGAYIRYDLLTHEMCLAHGWMTFTPSFHSQAACIRHAG